MRRGILLSIIIVAMVTILAFGMVGCKPGYKEVWEPVSVPTFEWTENNDIDIIKERLKADTLDATLDIEELVKIARDDGTFEGYDYSNGKKRQTVWHPIEHLRNLKSMQIAYNSEGNKYYHDDKVRNFIKKGVAFWAEKNFVCAWSGWYNDIGIGLYIPDILLLDNGDIAEADKTLLLNRIHGSLMQNSKKRFKLYERPVNDSGGNLTDQIIASLKVAVIEKDYNIIMWLRSLLENELRPFPAYKGPNYHRWDAEGPKEDYSFQQHDQLIYFGGYGEVFAGGVNRYLNYTKNTQFELNDKALNFYGRFLINGMQYAFRNTYRDISASGRGIARRNGLGGIYKSVANGVNVLLDYMATTDAKFDKDVVDGINYINDNRIQPILKGEADKGAGGHRYFYESDYNVYNGEKYMATVRHASNRTRMFEFLNEENKLGYYTGAGATFYHVNGDEYYNLMPVYDWNRIPGTTTRQGRVPTMNQDFSYNTYGNNEKVGGVSNGNVGLSTYRQNVNGVSAYKGYFMFEDGVVCLGSGVWSKLPGKVVTNINQTKLNGDFIMKQGDSVVTKSNGDFSGKYDYIYHSNIGYITDSEVSISAGERTGNWKRVYTLDKDDKVSENVFSIDINHGAYPVGKRYGYTVLMNTTPELMDKYVFSPTLEIINNDNSVQAVYDKKNDVLEVIFLKKGEIKVGDKVIKADGACSMIVESVKAQPIITMASNDYKEHDINIEVGSVKKSVHITKASKII